MQKLVQVQSSYRFHLHMCTVLLCILATLSHDCDIKYTCYLMISVRRKRLQEAPDIPLGGGGGAEGLHAPIPPRRKLLMAVTKILELPLLHSY